MTSSKWEETSDGDMKGDIGGRGRGGQRITHSSALTVFYVVIPASYCFSPSLYPTSSSDHSLQHHTQSSASAPTSAPYRSHSSAPSRPRPSSPAPARLASPWPHVTTTLCPAPPCSWPTAPTARARACWRRGSRSARSTLRGIRRRWRRGMLVSLGWRLLASEWSEKEGVEDGDGPRGG